MQVKTIKLTGEEIKVELERPYIFVEINNANNNEEILASVNPNIVRGNDNVLIIKSNSTGTLGDVGFPKIKEIYLSGTGKIEIIAKDFVTSSVNIYAKGRGGGGGFTPTPEVLDFLPHPEGIYAYWDWEYGVAGTSWTDMTNNNVIKCENDNGFGYDSGYLKLNKSGLDANLNVKDIDNVLIYHIVRLTGVGNAGSSRILSDAAGVYTEMHTFGGVYYTLRDSHNELSYLDCGKKGMTQDSIAVFAIRNTTDTTSLYSFQKDIFITSSKSKSFTSDIYMYGREYYYKAILLSNGGVFDNDLKDNMAAIYNKYST